MANFTTFFNSNNGKLSNELLEKFSKENNVSLENVRVMYKNAKANLSELKKARRMQAFNCEHCVISWNNHEMSFNPRLIEGSNAIYFTDIDRNAYVVVTCNNEGKVSVSTYSRVSEKNSKSELNTKLVKATKSVVISLFSDVVANLSFGEFLDKCKSAKSFKTVKCPIVLRPILFSEEVKEEKSLSAFSKSVSRKSVKATKKTKEKSVKKSA